MYVGRITFSVILGILFVWVTFFGASYVSAVDTFIVSTTTLRISICGDTIVNDGEECDVPGEVGVYSTTIIGRQCSAQCLYGPYCGDGILQTTYDEECDDGNNTSNDFCAADCTVENAGGGGGSSSGGGGGSSGGSPDGPMGDTQVSITGKAYPNATVNVLLDGDVIGTVRANNQADFTFSTDIEPGTNSFGFWAKDSNSIRSITLNTTFDVTQGAVTTISGIMLPPTIVATPSRVDKGSPITFSGKTVPNFTVKSYIDTSAFVESAVANSSGEWQLVFDTSRLSEATHTVKPKFEQLTGGKLTESNFGQTLSFYVGAGPTGEISSSDLNKDGKINLIDFSILIFWWGTNGGNSSPRADINANGKVGLEDFSILLFNWTG